MSIIYIDKNIFDKINIKDYQLQDNGLYKITVPTDLVDKIPHYKKYKIKKDLDEDLVNSLLDYPAQKYHNHILDVYVKDKDKLKIIDKLEPHHFLHSNPNFIHQFHRHLNHEFTDLPTHTVGHKHPLIQKINKYLPKNLTNCTSEEIDKILGLKKIGNLRKKVNSVDEFFKDISESNFNEKYVLHHYFDNHNIKNINNGVFPIFPYPSFLHHFKIKHHPHLYSKFDHIVNTHKVRGVKDKLPHSKVKVLDALFQYMNDYRMKLDPYMMLGKSHFQCPNIDCYDYVIGHSNLSDLNHEIFEYPEEACQMYLSHKINGGKSYILCEDDHLIVGFNDKVKLHHMDRIKNIFNIDGDLMEGVFGDNLSKPKI